MLEVRRHRYRRRSDLVELFLMSSEEVVNLVLDIHRQEALDRIVVDIDAEERRDWFPRDTAGLVISVLLRTLWERWRQPVPGVLARLPAHLRCRR